MNLEGLGVAMITPFDIYGKVDYDSIPNIVENIISGGADYLVLMGTTAEVPCLSTQEKKDIIKIVKEANHNRVPMVIGIGGNSTYNVIDEICQTDLSSFGAILSVSPYYNKPSQEGIYQHFSEIANFLIRFISVRIQRYQFFRNFCTTHVGNSFWDSEKK